MKGEIKMENKDLYTYISIQKKQIEEFEKKELERITVEVAKKLGVDKKIIDLLLSFYECKSIEDSYDVLTNSFNDSVNNESMIILNPVELNGYKEIIFDKNKKTFTLNFTKDSDLWVMNNNFIEESSSIVLKSKELNADSKENQDEDDTVDGQTNLEDYGVQIDENYCDEEEAINESVEGRTSAFNNILGVKRNK